MGELVQDNWIFLVIALVVGLLVAWWIFAASRRTRVEIARPEEDVPAKRNQALIDSPPVAPPVVPPGLAGTGTAVEAAVEEQRIEAAAAGGGADDLTRIKGLGPKLASTLNALGVTRFEQIAGWSDAEIDRIDAQLGRFSGRIRRDDWVEQAGYLARGDTEGFQARFGAM